MVFQDVRLGAAVIVPRSGRFDLVFALLRSALFNCFIRITPQGLEVRIVRRYLIQSISYSSRAYLESGRAWIPSGYRIRPALGVLGGMDRLEDEAKDPTSDGLIPQREPGGTERTLSSLASFWLVPVGYNALGRILLC